MKKIIWMEMLLIGASILIFRSVWTLLDSIPWASGRVGLAVLLVAGIFAAVFALRSIEALSEKKGRESERYWLFARLDSELAALKLQVWHGRKDRFMRCLCATRVRRRGVQSP